jgi:hypothetical protein
MLRRTTFYAAIVAAFLIPLPRNAEAKTQIGLILHDGVKVRSRPSTSAHVLAVLVQQAQVEVIGKQRGWDRVKLWASVRGWVQARDVTFRKPWTSTSTYRAPTVHYHVRAHGPYSIHARALTTATTTLSARPGSAALSTVRGGATVTVSAWQQDKRGHLWYRIGARWARGESIQFQFADPSLTQANGAPLWSRVRGKGMWLTLGTVGETSPATLLRAAARSGITHIYLESAISPLGFHGIKSVGPLIDAAHRSKVAVIAWVYPYLVDIGADVALTRQVAAFRTASGNGFDGVAADVERNFTLPNVRGYSQLTRYYLGPHYLLVAATYPPQSAPEYPFAEVAHDYNVIAPMDYWHQTKTDYGLDYGHMRYGYSYGYRYAVDSVASIRREAPRARVSPIGQTFDDFGRLEMGPHAPTADEIRGFLQGSKASGAIGASFFQWMTATDAEWRAIGAFRF